LSLEWITCTSYYMIPHNLITITRVYHILLRGNIIYNTVLYALPRIWRRATSSEKVDNVIWFYALRLLYIIYSAVVVILIQIQNSITIIHSSSCVQIDFLFVSSINSFFCPCSLLSLVVSLCVACDLLLVGGFPTRTYKIYFGFRKFFFSFIATHYTHFETKNQRVCSKIPTWIYVLVN